ncbi:ComEA family DNA-binding protein [Desulfoscipio geothermicus]|uniref:Competence protein ComEA n=1 Tax=Desulfoscipio geothermicus DSM 3669 TaxID=1121426 RepID=A0A1I6D1L6_9FIRM|nr:ComEA family DNA-binding protein [Desulfoscipio geothermicus]SFQ99365.1 competence protein ComEA [Desulfoscipio geothermicus DSM 3669]
MQLEKRHQLVLLIIAAFILFGAGYKYALIKEINSAGDKPLVMSAGGAENGREVSPAGEQGKTAGSGEIVVHVVGAVQKPGLYRLSPGSRVGDAVHQAGPTNDSALDYLNLAAPLEDGRQIVVPSLEDIKSRQSAAAAVPQKPAGSVGAVASGLPGAAPASPPAYAAPGGTGSAGKINLNTAGTAELEKLPGIGPALAQRIIDYRNQNGPFMVPEDIKNVSGIGDKRFEQIKDMIFIN